MKPMSFHPVVADIGAQVVNMGITSLEDGTRASTSMTELAPAGTDEVSAQAAIAFHTQANSLLALHNAAQEELMRAGAALTQIADTYIQTDEAAAENLMFAAFPISNPWLRG
jgi:hypothetical protein